MNQNPSRIPQLAFPRAVAAAAHRIPRESLRLVRTRRCGDMADAENAQESASNDITMLDPN